MSPQKQQKRREIIRLLIKRIPTLTEDRISAIVDPLDTLEQMEQFLVWLEAAQRPGYQSSLMNALEISGVL